MDIVKKRSTNRQVRLRRVFARYIAVFCIMTILLFVLMFFSFLILLSEGVILPADYELNQLTAAKEKIASSDKVTPDLIPESCRYAVFTNDGETISGNLSSDEADKAWSLTQKTGIGHSSARFYLRIVREGEVCIVRYAIMAKFSDPALRDILPPPEILWILIFILAFLAEIFILASSFGKLLTEKMSGIQNATKKIQDQDLDFSVEPSGILEVDNVLNSIDKMKEALKASLKAQWNMEKTRREQISALAHDVKTPLTVIRGNTELLAETDLTEEQKQYTGYIKENTERMEQYIRTLIKMSQAETGSAFCVKKINSDEYMEEICRQISALASAKGLKADFSIGDLPLNISADPDLLQRAIMNVVSNAVEYSRAGSIIRFEAETEDKRLRFCVIDSGKGFSQEDLLHATEQFYMGDKSRSSKGHCGMGLNIARSVAELHKGALTIANDDDTGGGRVTIEIPIFK